MRLRALAPILCAVSVASACGAGGFFRQYEYDEEVYLDLDGSATVQINSSIPALNALRGTTFDTRPTARVDRAAVRAYFSSPDTHVTWVRDSRRNNRRFVHVRLDVDDIRRLGSVAPFAWSSYRFQRSGDQVEYAQTIGPAAGRDVGSVGWKGNELVAFRLHLPSRITSQPPDAQLRRGNILVWEQPLADRLRSAPLALDVRMESQSILSRTLVLFAATFTAVAIGFAAVIWWLLRGGGARQPVGQV